MSGALTLPVHIARAKNATWLIPVMIGNQFLMAGVLFFALSNAKINPPAVPAIAAAAMIILGTSVSALFLILSKPANITITQSSVDIVPIPVLGFKIVQHTTMPIANFEKLEIFSVRGKYDRKSYFIALRAKPPVGVVGSNKKNDIVFALPPQQDAQNYPRQLAALINLPMVDNA